MPRFEIKFVRNEWKQGWIVYDTVRRCYVHSEGWYRYVWEIYPTWWSAKQAERDYMGIIDPAY